MGASCPSQDTPTILAKAWGWRHPGRKAWALRDLDLRIEPGEVVLIAGNSGAGKSTLLHGIAGVLDDGEGESVGALTVGGLSPSDSQVRGQVGLVQQDPESQRVMGRLGDEVAFGLENLGVPRDEIWPRVATAVTTVGLDRYPLDHSTANLSGGEKQRLALACALAMRPRVILLDEPTANLDADGSEEVRQAAEKLSRESGASLIVVEHNLGPWLSRADRLVILSDGRIVADGTPDEVVAANSELLTAAGVWVPGVDPLSFIPTSAGPAPVSRNEVSSEPVAKERSADRAPLAALTTENLGVGYEDGPAVLEGLNLAFPRGESTCVLGPNGAGKTTLALTLAGLLPARSGGVSAHIGSSGTEGHPTTTSDPHDWAPSQLLGRISMVFQEPQYQFLTGSVAEELALGPQLAGMKPEEVNQRVERYLSVLQLDHLRLAHPLSLSGGEKRRLGVGTALIATPQILILDEPTFGQDFNTWVALVTLLLEAVESGATLITITHDPNLVRALGDHRVEVTSERKEDSLDAPQAGSTLPRPRRWLARVNPVTQILGLLLMTLPLLLSIDPVSAGTALVLEILLLPLTGLSPRQILARVSPLLLAAPLAALSMLLYGAPGGTIYAHWGPATISENSIVMAVSITLRVCAVAMPAVIILPGLGSTETADALTQIAHLPARVVLSSLAAIRMVGLMLGDWRALARARRSRGMKGTHFARSAFSLVTFALRRADSLSVSMEARGFGAAVERTNARTSSLSGADAGMLVVAVLVPVVSLSISVLSGSFTWFGIG